MVQMNRRSFIGRAAMSSVAAELAVHGLCPRVAQAQQYTSILSYFMGNNPILGVVALFELFAKPTTPTISDVVSSISVLAQDLNTHFDDLQRHFHEMLAVALDEFALKQDTIHLKSLAYRVNIAKAGGSIDSEMRNLSGAIDDVTSSLGSRGVAGSFSYLNAIALQNVMHKVLASPPQVIIAVNEPHVQILGNIIYDGTTEGTLEKAIIKKRIEMNATPPWTNFRSLKQKIGESFKLGVITAYYQSGAVSTSDYIYKYEGFQRGEPVGSRWYGPEKLAAGASNFRGRLIRATFTPFDRTEAYPVAVDSNGRLWFPEASPSARAVVEQINDVVADYRRLYNPSCTPEISGRTNTDFGMTDEHAKLRTYLIDVGLNSVKQLVSSSSARLAQSVIPGVLTHPG